jgi:hypothetical protein
MWKNWFEKNKTRIRGVFIFIVVVSYFILAVQITRFIIRNDLVNKAFGVYNNPETKANTF